MCTAVTFHTRDHYFGRNLDLKGPYRETVTITPRNYPFSFRKVPSLNSHFAMIGVALVEKGYPLYYDAVNEKGLAIAGLNYPGNAVYHPEKPGKDNVSPFELIPWILSQCADLSQARMLLDRISLWDSPFSGTLPLSALHWILSDREASITLEPMSDGLHIYENPMGVLTNNPPFDFMTRYLAAFRELSPRPSENRLCPELTLNAYCQGLAAMGLPGDHSSPSRFVRASFVKLNSTAAPTEQESVSQFFHILSAVEMPRGCVELEEGGYDITVYSSCCNQDTGVYYYTTYDTRQIRGVDLHREDLEGSRLVSFPMYGGDWVIFRN